MVPRWPREGDGWCSASLYLPPPPEKLTVARAFGRPSPVRRWASFSRCSGPRGDRAREATADVVPSTEGSGGSGGRLGVDRDPPEPRIDEAFADEDGDDDGEEEEDERGSGV